MDKTALLHEISKTLTKNKAADLAKLASQGTMNIIDLLDACYHPQKATAFRAAWILEALESKNPLLFTAILDRYIQRLAEQKNPSCQRHFSKILIQYTKPRSSEIRQGAFNALSIDLKERVVEVLFEWLIKTDTPVAVQVNCMDVLFYMIPAFPWIAEELESQIVFYLQDGSAAMQSRGRKILAKMRRR